MAGHPHRTSGYCLYCAAVMNCEHDSRQMMTAVVLRNIDALGKPACRWRHDSELKRQVIAECAAPDLSVAQVAMSYGLKATLAPGGSAYSVETVPPSIRYSKPAEDAERGDARNTIKSATSCGVAALPTGMPPRASMMIFLPPS